MYNTHKNIICTDLLCFLSYIQRQHSDHRIIYWFERGVMQHFMNTITMFLPYLISYILNVISLFFNIEVWHSFSVVMWYSINRLQLFMYHTCSKFLCLYMYVWITLKVTVTCLCISEKWLCANDITHTMFSTLWRITFFILAYITIIVEKFYAPTMFHLDIMNKNEANCYKTVVTAPKAYTVFYRTA